MFDKFISHEDLERTYGKRGIFFSAPPSLDGVLAYIGGIPAFDHLGPKKMSDILTVQDRGGALAVLFLRGTGADALSIVDVPNEVVEGVIIEDRAAVQKQKSVLTRALVGGVLLGPLGAVVGGMSGIGTKPVHDSIDDLLLSIWCGSGQQQTTILFTLPFKERERVERFFQLKYPKHYGREPELKIQGPGGDDVLERLERVANLRDRGIISEEEFQRKRDELAKLL